MSNSRIISRNRYQGVPVHQNSDYTFIKASEIPGYTSDKKKFAASALRSVVNKNRDSIYDSISVLNGGSRNSSRIYAVPNSFVGNSYTSNVRR